MSRKVTYIGMGSNLGDREENLRAALNSINGSSECRVTAVSSLYESAPYGGKDQPSYYNMAAEVETTLTPRGLLDFLKEIERAVGRRERERWGSREIDLDILLYNGEVISEEGLKVPHYDMLNRDFVMTPLNEIASDVIHPTEKKEIRELTGNPTEKTLIRKQGTPEVPEKNQHDQRT